MCQCTKSHSQERYHNQVMAINISLQVFSLRLFVVVYKLVNVVLSIVYQCT